MLSDLGADRLFLVVGAGSFLGRTLVSVLDRASIGYIATTRTGRDVGPIRTTAWSIGDGAPRLAGIEDVTDVVLLATVAGVSGETQAQIFESNALIAKNVVEQCHRLPKLKNVLFSSSMAVYGRRATPLIIDEKSLATPSNVYGASKLATEFTLVEELSNATVLCPRVPGIVGVGAVHGWLPSLAADLTSGAPVRIHHPDSLFNQCIDVVDLAEWLVVCCLQSSGISCVGPIGTKPDMTVRSVVETLAKSLDSRSPILEVELDRKPSTVDYSAWEAYGYRARGTSQVVESYSASLRLHR